MDNQQENLENSVEPHLESVEIAPSAEDEVTGEDKVTQGIAHIFQHIPPQKIAMYAITIVVLVMVLWGVGALIVHATHVPPEPTPVPTATRVSLPETVPTPVFMAGLQTDGLMRSHELQTTPMAHVERRYDVITYTVDAGDSIFGIADKFGLRPETVLWSNRYTIGDTPDGLRVGVELFILPMDGVYHRWAEGEGLNGVASFYGVSPEDIVNFPGNDLDPDEVGEFSNPNIAPGTMLVVPGGRRPTIAWIVPRDSPASASSHLGPGACGGILYGITGTGTFTYPTTERWLSGYDFNPPVHNGLDFAGRSGFAIFASDSGVIVYSGWSDRGYGNLIVIDHGSGWQTFYAHLLDGSMLPCGSNVQKGQLIASMGSTGMSTGPHLHFEIRLNGFPVNPWQFLQ